MNWVIEKRKISDLKGYEKNPRKFTKKGLKELKESLQKYCDVIIQRYEDLTGNKAELVL